MSVNDIGHQWDGEQATWPRHKLMIQKFKNANEKKFADFPWFFTAKDPRERGRITEDYNVEEPDSDDDDIDDSGAEPGTKIKKETEQGFKKACRLYKKAKGRWFTILAASIAGGIAEEAVMRMQSSGKMDGKKLEEEITAAYETKSNQHASHLFKSWVSEHKSEKATIEEHNKQWNRTCDIINNNLDWDTMQCYLYLISLGPRWETFYDHMTTTVGSAVTKMDLQSLQRAAVDWMRSHNIDTTDESRPQQIAFFGQQQTGHSRGTKRKRQENEFTSKEKQQRPCIQCGHPIHNWHGCFSGALDWMDAEQRRQYIEADRIKRGYYNGNNNQNRNHRNQSHNSNQNNHSTNKQNQHQQQQQQTHTDTASLAQLQKQHDEQMYVLQETLRSKHLHGVANELNSAGFKLDMS